jgi:4-amino-4-deoxy-L-arabinose transferase-like glycosyltransferase
VTTVGAAPARPFDRSTAAAAALLAVTSLLHVWYAGAVPLSAREAWAWDAARHLGVPDPSGPPLLAWTIRATTAAFGTSERSVRLAATIHAAVAGWFFFLAARRLLGGRVALVGLLAALATPLFALGQAAATRDAPLLAGWCVALYCTVRALEGGGAWLLGAGAGAAWATLADPIGALLVPQIAAALALDPAGRRHLRGPWPTAGLAVALALSAPALAWAARAGVGAALPLRGPVHRPSLDGVLGFLGAQALLVTPILGGVLWVAAGAAAVDARTRALRLAGLFAVPALALTLALSPFATVQGSGPAPGYVGALLAAAAFLADAPRERRGVAALAVATGISATTYLHLVALLPDVPFPPREVTTVGWPELGARVAAERQRLRGDAFVLGCSGATASALAFYLPDHPRTYGPGPLGDPSPPHDSWAPERIRAGREGLVVLDRRDRGRCARRAEACAPLERLRPLTVRRKGQPVTTFDLFRCRYRAPPR